MKEFYKWYTEKIKAQNYITNEEFDRIVCRYYLK